MIHQTKLRKANGNGTQSRIQREGSTPRTQSDNSMRWLQHRNATGRKQHLEGLARKHGLEEAYNINEDKRLKANIRTVIDWSQCKDTVLEAMKKSTWTNNSSVRRPW